jgi:hypothetical protein
VIGGPRVINPDVIARAEEITLTDRRVSSVAISEVISDAPEIPSISPTTVRRIQRTLGFSYLPPIATLPSSLQDGTSVHTAAAMMTYLTTMVNVLPGLPAGLLDPNPIENPWAVLKRRVE